MLYRHTHITRAVCMWGSTQRANQAKPNTKSEGLHACACMWLLVRRRKPHHFSHRYVAILSWVFRYVGGRARQIRHPAPGIWQRGRFTSVGRYRHLLRFPFRPVPLHGLSPTAESMVRRHGFSIVRSEFGCPRPVAIPVPANRWGTTEHWYKHDIFWFCREMTYNAIRSASMLMA